MRTCPPCDNGCVQGRYCPNLKPSASDRRLLHIAGAALVVFWFGLAVIVWLA